jgi:hypothetical protein
MQRFAVVFLTTCVFSVLGSQSVLLARTLPQQPAVGPSFLQEEGGAEVQASSTASLTGTPQCDTILSDPICFASKQQGKQQVLLPNAVPNGLVGHWDFNSDQALDSSGNGNHAVTELVHGPSPAGNGHSGKFNNNFMMVPNTPMFKAQDFTYSFWIYLLDDETPKGLSSSATWCPLIRKGVHMLDTQQFANAPALLYSHRTGHLRAELTTSLRNTEGGEHVDSNARLLPNRWMHIAMVRHSSRSSLLLYVNGILDNAMTTQGTLVPNDYPLYVGGDPFTMNQCTFTVYMDELRVFTHAVPPHQLQAEAAPALGGIDPAYVRLGCLSCSLEEAARRCPKNRHVCTSIELHTGGYNVARSLGWLGAGTHVWTHAAVLKGAAQKMSAAGPDLTTDSLTGLSLCCEGPP